MSMGMDIEGFEDLLDRLGSDLDCWPPADRAAADALLSRSVEAHAALEMARVVQSQLDAPDAPAGDRLRRAVLEIPMMAPRVPARNRPRFVAGIADLLGQGWRLATAGAGMALATGLLGFVLGYGQLVQLPGIATADTLTDTPEQELFALLDNLYELEELP